MMIFSNEKCDLGEGPLWHPQRRSLFWLDILQRKLFEKKHDSINNGFDHAWDLLEYTSVIALDKHNPGVLWMVTDKSFGKFDLSTGFYNKLLDLNLNKAHRANDGSVSPAGDFWFGTMEWEPEGVNGDVFSITAAAKLIKHQVKLGIPNTFCWDAGGAGILITDSFQQQIFHYQVSQGKIRADSRVVFKDLRGSNPTPDGGVLDIEGMLWNAHWDGSKVVKYNQMGVNQGEIVLPVPRPTSCCFGGQDNNVLFITTAKTGLSNNDVEKYPLSGSVFAVEVEAPGLPVATFGIDE